MDRDTLPYIEDVAERLESLKSTCREHAEYASELRAKALLETTAEVANGLLQAYRHYEQGTEDAWRGDESDVVLAEP